MEDDHVSLRWRRARANRKADAEWRRVRGQLYGEHPGWFDYLDY